MTLTRKLIQDLSAIYVTTKQKADISTDVKTQTHLYQMNHTCMC